MANKAPRISRASLGVPRLKDIAERGTSALVLSGGFLLMRGLHQRLETPTYIFVKWVARFVAYVVFNI